MRAVDSLLTSKFVRFLIIGGFNTLIAYGAYALFLFLGFAYALANFLSLLVGIAVAFKTQGTFVFSNADNRLFLRFVVCWLIIYVINVGIIRQFLVWGLDAYTAGALALPFIALISFTMQSRLVFRRSAGP